MAAASPPPAKNLSTGAGEEHSTAPHGDDVEAPEDFDWSSVEQVTALVSKTTLAGLQQLWRQHAGSMDLYGRSFAENLYNLHSQVIKDIASVKSFELKAVTALLNTFTEQAREMMMSSFQHMRTADDSFSNRVYQNTRTAFTRNLRTALEARDAWYRDKLRAMRSKHEAQVQAVRAAAAVELQQRSAQMRVALARALAKSAAAGPGGKLDTSAALSALGASGTGGPNQAGGNDPEASMLEELFEDATAADALNRQLQERLDQTSKEVEELKHKMDDAEERAQTAESEALSWRNKWAVESTKTDAIKREAMAIISQCESHVSKLQQQHISELTQRDYVLQRARDTITNLERRLAAVAPASAGGVGRLSPAESLFAAGGPLM